MLPTFAPRQRPLQESCIDHLTLWDPKGLSSQHADLETLPTAFLDHRGVLGTIQLPIPIRPDLPLPNTRPPRVPTFRYPIPEHTLEGWKSEIAVDYHGAIAMAQTLGHSMLASLPQHARGPPTYHGSDSHMVGSDIIGLANDIQSILGDALSEATKMFPLKTPTPLGKGTLPRHL